MLTLIPEFARVMTESNRRAATWPMKRPNASRNCESHPASPRTEHRLGHEFASERPGKRGRPRRNSSPRRTRSRTCGRRQWSPLGRGSLSGEQLEILQVIRSSPPHVEGLCSPVAVGPGRAAGRGRSREPRSWPMPLLSWIRCIRK